VPIPQFILDLRAQVGHDLLWLPGVSAVVLDGDGRVLLGRRADNGLWAVPSGIMEPGEQPAQAVRREVAEETGIDIVVDAMTAVCTDDAPITYANGDLAQYLDLCFACRPVGGWAHVADDESTEVAWFDLHELPEPLTTSSRDRIDRTLAYLAGPQPGQPWFTR
jgi:ADP-ribose pyrophosphatase YjhB (NUDIX family)